MARHAPDTRVDWAGDRDRDRPRQARSPGLLPSTTSRSSRRGAPATPRTCLVELADRRLPVRPAVRGRPDGLGDVARTRRSRSGGSAASACSTSRACGPATTDPTPLARRDRLARPSAGDGADAGDLRRADQARADHRAPQADARRRGDRRRCAVPAAHPAALEDRRRRRRRPVRHPRHHRVGRARLQPRPSRSTSSGSSTSSTCRSSSAAPRPTPRRCTSCAPARPGVLVGFGGGAAHTTRQRSASTPRWRPRSPTSPRARRDYLDESGGRYVHVIADGGMGTSGRHRQGDRLRRRRRDARARRWPGRSEAPGRGFHWGPEAHHARAAARRAASQVGAVASLEEILLRARAGPPTARRTSSAPCVGRWRPPATPTSRSSSASRSSSRRTRTGWAPDPRLETSRSDRPRRQ